MTTEEIQVQLAKHATPARLPVFVVLAMHCTVLCTDLAVASSLYCIMYKKQEVSAASGSWFSLIIDCAETAHTKPSVHHAHTHFLDMILDARMHLRLDTYSSSSVEEFAAAESELNAGSQSQQYEHKRRPLQRL